MADSVSTFQTEVAAVMELLLKVAVVEITKVFERRSFVSGSCSEKFCEDSLRDLRAFTERTWRNPVCSVGVQAGEASSLLELHDEGICKEEAIGVEDGLPSINSSLAFVETVNVQCTVDLPCNTLNDNVVKGETGVDLTLITSNCLEIPQAELTTQQTVLEASLHDFFPSSDTLNTNVNLALNSLGQSSLKVTEIHSLQPVTNLVKVELPETTVSTTEHSKALENDLPAAIKASDAHNIKFQLSHTQSDCRPCSVQLVNLLQVSNAKKTITDSSSGKASSVPKDLRTHQHVHTGRRLCCFTECGNGVWRLQGSLSHRRLHGCNICGKKFQRKKILRRHERFHSGEKPYSCSRCTKVFALRKSLRRHERFHTGERPHSCPHCGKKFRLKDNLKAHLRFHTGEKPFTCNLCPRGFRMQKNLHKHLLIHSVPVK